MPWPKQLTGWLPGRRRGAAQAAAAPIAGPPLFVLNSLIDLPTSYATAPYEAGSDADFYFFDYNYIDRRRTTGCLARLAQARETRGLDFSNKTLLLAAKGLHPAAAELLELPRQFRRHAFFYELWNGLKEIVELAQAGIDTLYFLPVSKRLDCRAAPHLSERRNRRIFVSLGGDDDIDLIRAVVGRCPDLQFYVPNVSWTKPGSEKHYFDVALSAANVRPVDCSIVRTEQQLSFSNAYRAAYEDCDTVLIATMPDKLYQMRGGIRLADAFFARKQIVLTENPLCQLLMAQHERTCLVATHDADDIAAQLMRSCSGAFHVHVDLYEQIRHLTVEEAKLPWMLGMATDPERARRSPFARGTDLLETARRALYGRGRTLLDREVETLAREAGQAQDGAPRAPRSS